LTTVDTPGSLLQLNGCALLVEDNVTNQIVASAFLKKMGVTYTIAQNGKEALDLIRSGKTFDVVLMDLFMPVMNGIDATKAIRSWENSNNMTLLPIVALSGDVYSETITECMQSGMNCFVKKPIDLNELNSILANFLIKSN
jgi:CheY-like chemotaxis protein